MKPTILNKQNVAETKYLNLVMTTFENKQGKPSQWLSAERPGNQHAVVIVAMVQDTINNPLLVVTKEYRIPIQGYEWGCPAGLIEPGQSIHETAKRELKEETGLDVIRFIRPVTPMVYNSAGMTNEAVSFAFVEASGTISQENLQDSEDITTFLYSRASVQQLLQDAMDSDTETFIGAKSWLIFERFVKYGDI
jgi:ADP-ribose pyrophosphatase